MRGVESILGHDHADVDTLAPIFFDEAGKVGSVGSKVGILLNEHVGAHAVIYAAFRRQILSSHSCIEIRLQADCPFERMREALPANKRSDNSQSGMISENDRITC